MANEVGNKSVSIYFDDQAAVDSLERLQKSADKLNTNIEEGRKKQKALNEEIEKAKKSGANYTKLEKDLKKVNTELAKNEKAVAKNTEQQKALQQQIDTKTGPSLRQQETFVRRLWNEYKSLGENTEEAKRKLQEYIAASDKLDAMKGRVDNVRKAQEAAGKASTSFFGSFVGNLAANAVMRVSDLLSNFFNDAVQEAMEAEESTARFGATLDNLGRNDAFDRIMNKADQLAQKFSYLDNDEIVGVFNKLIDYGKLTEKQMNDLLPVIIDFAAKQRISLTEASSVVIKALEGNGKALKEYGINIKDAKDEGERLNVVMTTLKEKVEGAGEAFMDTAKGGIAEARQELANTKEELGTGLIPMINKLLKALNYVLIGAKDIASRVKNVFSDMVAFGNGGTSEYLANIGARAAEEQEEINKKTVQAFIENLEGKGADEITAALIDIQQKIADKQKFIATSAAGIKNGTTSKEDVANAKNAVTVLKTELDALLKYQDSLTNPEVLGTGGETDDDEAKKKAEEARKKAEAERKRQLEQLKKDQEDLDQFLKQKAFDRSMFDMSEREKEIARLAEAYEEKRKLAHDDKKRLKDLDESYWKDVLQINAKFGRQHLEQLKKQEEEQRKSREEHFANAARAGMAQLQNIRGNIEAAQTKANRERLNAAELKVLQAGNFQKLQAERELLAEKERQEIEAAIKRGESTALIEEQYRQQKLQAEMAFYANLASTVLSFAQQISDIASLDAQAKANRENAELARLQKRNEREKGAHQKLLNNKLISQQEYNKRAKTLDDQYRAQEAAAKKRQWERQQRADIANAIISGAQAVLSALQTKPFALGLVMAGLAAYKTKKQIDVIKSQEAPEFAKGGIPQGPLHKDGGINMIDSKTGKKVGEMEGGEPYMILSRNTYRNNKAIVDELLQSSLYRNGAPIAPRFRSRVFKTLDYEGLRASVENVRYFQNGGAIQTNSAAAGAETAPQTVAVPVMSETQELLLKAVYDRLNEPIKAVVVYGEYEAAAQTVNQIKQDTSFVKQ